MCILPADKITYLWRPIAHTAALDANNGFGPIPWKNDYQNYSYLNS